MDQYIDQLIQLWNGRQEHEENLLAPLFPFPIPEGAHANGSFLVIGMNPSFSANWFGGNIVTNYINNYGFADANAFLQWARRAEDELFDEQIRDLDQLALKNHPYFHRPQELANHFNMPFAHLDLFAYRVTNQHELFEIFADPDNLNHLIPFSQGQLEIFRGLLPLYNPKVIVVANAAACRLMQSIYGAAMEMDDEQGCRYLTLNNDQHVPVFFSGMLSGQRCLDSWSLERLKWHIGKVLDWQRRQG